MNIRLLKKVFDKSLKITKEYLEGENNDRYRI